MEPSSAFSANWTKRLRAASACDPCRRHARHLLIVLALAVVTWILA
jgi:hypothetical protein